MITLRCTAKLLRRLRQPAKLSEPAPPTNPLGEWYADIDFIDREPFVTLLNATTGASMLLSGRAESLKDLHIHAGQQFFKLLVHYGFKLEWPACGAELSAWDMPPVFANTRDRSLLGSMNRYKDEAWHHFAYFNRSLPEAASRGWEGLFSHPSLPKSWHGGGHWARPLDLVVAKLAPLGTVLVELDRGRLNPNV